MKLARLTLLGLYMNFVLVILFLARLIFGLIDTKIQAWTFWIILIALIISGFLNVLMAVLNVFKVLTIMKNKDYDLLRKHMKMLKFGSILYFILNFVLYFLLFAIFILASRGILLISPFPLLFLIPASCAYFTVVITSVYGIGVLLSLLRNKKISLKGFILHIVMQLCFVLDILSTAIILIKFKKEEKNDESA